MYLMCVCIYFFLLHLQLLCSLAKSPACCTSDWHGVITGVSSFLLPLVHAIREKLKAGASYLAEEHPKPKGEPRRGQTHVSRKPSKSPCDSWVPDPSDGCLEFTGLESAKQILPSKGLSTLTTKKQKTIFSPARATSLFGVCTGADTEMR